MHNNAKRQPFAFSDFDERPAPAFCEAGADAIEKARKEGFEAGLDEARAEARAREADALGAIAAALGEKVAEFDAGLAAERRALKSLAAEFLKAFAGKIAADREIAFAVDLVRRLLAASADRAPAVLALHPESLARLGARLRERIAEAGAASFVALEGDAALAPHDIRLSWRGGAAARRLSRAIEEIDLMIARANKETAS
ncbi:MAG: hypothetical protein AB7P23_09365 [Amphiplicatus sp.]